MNVPDLKVELVCLFCGTLLQGGEDVVFTSGDLIKCQQCNEDSDYDSVLEVAKEKGVNQMKELIAEQLQKKFKEMFK